MLLIAFNVMSGSLQCALQWLSNHLLCLICLMNLLNVSIIIDNVVDKLMFIVIEYFMNFFFIRNLTKQKTNIKCIYSAFSFLGCKSVGLKDLRFTKLAYTKKINVLMPKVHKTCIYSKTSKVLIGKNHQTCIYSKPSTKINNLRLYVGLTDIDELVFDYLDF